MLFGDRVYSRREEFNYLRSTDTVTFTECLLSNVSKVLSISYRLLLVIQVRSSAFKTLMSLEKLRTTHHLVIISLPKHAPSSKFNANCVRSLFLFMTKIAVHSINVNPKTQISQLVKETQRCHSIHSFMKVTASSNCARNRVQSYVGALQN